MIRYQVRTVRLVLVVLLASAVVAMVLAAPVPVERAYAAAIKAPPVPAAIKAQPVTTGRLRDPAVFTFARDGRIFYGEKATGQIHILNRRAGSNSLFFTFPNLYSPRESGLLGLALHPRYPSVPYVYRMERSSRADGW